MGAVSAAPPSERRDRMVGNIEGATQSGRAKRLLTRFEAALGLPPPGAPLRPHRVILTSWLICTLPAFAISTLVHLLFWMEAQPGNGRAATYGSASLGDALLAVFIAPAGETLLMFPVVQLFERICLAPVAVVALTAVVFASLHGLVAAGWPLTAFWPFLVFSTLFVNLRHRAGMSAFAVTAAVHALNNLSVVVVVSLVT